MTVWGTPDTIGVAMLNPRRKAPLRIGFSLVVVLLVCLTGCSPAANHAPVAVADVRPQEGYEPLVVHVDASQSYDLDGDMLSYVWTVDEGDPLEEESAKVTLSAGDHTVSLSVADEDGETDTASVSVTVGTIPDGYVMERFEWQYADETQYWDLLVPWSLYRTYRDRIRNTAEEKFDYGYYVEDPLDEPTIEDYSALLWERSGEDVDAFIECTLFFCQGAITYEADPSGKEWPLYPIETLVDGAGDCEDSTILFVSLLRGRGVHASIAFVDTNTDGIPDHVLGLVPVTSQQEAALSCSGVVEIGGVRYAIAETATDEYLPLGCSPWELDSSDVYEVWAF
ncbi:MAG: PKD domain-containing protein [Candidatus Bipolaricaulota bacterium]|nr:PKD domain-containing protein [Candidatus Bipolaricaulota bacterium]